MEHKPVIELQAIADVRPIEAPRAMSREERLERWIEALEANPTRKLRSLYEIEYLSPQERQECRSSNSPLTVAYEDPLLRAQGLKSDRVGDCLHFFELTDRQMHHAFCSCHVGRNFDAKQAAQRLRDLLPRNNPISSSSRSIVQRIGAFFAAR